MSSTRRRRGQIEYQKPTHTLEHPWRVSVWIPGTAKPKLRPSPGVSKSGHPYLRDDAQNAVREGAVYDAVLAHLLGNYQVELLQQYLPIQKPSYCLLSVRFWFQTSIWDRAHLEPPDVSNLVKSIEDAVTGRLIQKPPIIYHDDSLVTDYYPPSGKRYWDPTKVDEPGYPQEPGYQITFTLCPPGWPLPELHLLT